MADTTLPSSRAGSQRDEATSAFGERSVLARRRWVLLLTLDVAALAMGASASYWTRSMAFTDRPFEADAVALGAMLVVLVWLVSLASVGVYNRRVIATGPEEYRRLLLASLMTVAVLSTVSYLLKLEVSRGLLIIQVPVGTALLLLVHALHASWVSERRRSGVDVRRTAVVGIGSRASELAASFAAHAERGYQVVAIIAPPGDTDLVDAWIEMLCDRMASLRVEAVALTSAPTLTPEVIRRLGWRLEGTAVEMMVSPDFTDIGGPRLTVSHAADLPILHLDEPQLSGPKRATKRAMDLVGSGLLLILVSPVLVVLALAVRLTSRGPAFYRQERVGRDGTPFLMFKLRTMRTGADELQDQVWHAGEALGTTSKHPDDPRVTPVGRVLRRWSLDEVPQLINVLRGDMSLVGPRPLQPVEVATLPGEHARRLIARPGMTGLWQISGRSARTWEERMQMDLRYVERWSPSLDLVILARTVGAVVSGRGAY